MVEICIWFKTIETCFNIFKNKVHKYCAIVAIYLSSKTGIAANVLNLIINDFVYAKILTISIMLGTCCNIILNLLIKASGCFI